MRASLPAGCSPRSSPTRAAGPRCWALPARQHRCACRAHQRCAALRWAAASGAWDCAAICNAHCRVPEPNAATAISAPPNPAYHCALQHHAVVRRRWLVMQVQVVHGGCCRPPGLVLRPAQRASSPKLHARWLDAVASRLAEVPPPKGKPDAPCCECWPCNEGRDAHPG